MARLIMKDATAAIAPAADDADTPTGTFDVILSAPTLDRDGETLGPDEWEQPLPSRIPFDMDHAMTCASVVGSGTPSIDPDTGNLRVSGSYSSDPDAQRLRNKVNEKHITTTSVTFLEKHDVDPDGNPVVKRELLNGTFTPIPANRDAVVVSSKSAALALRTKEGRRNSMSDQSTIQQMHDKAVELGAVCPAMDGPSGKAYAAAEGIEAQAPNAEADLTPKSDGPPPGDDEDEDEPEGPTDPGAPQPNVVAVAVPKAFDPAQGGDPENPRPNPDVDLTAKGDTKVSDTPWSNFDASDYTPAQWHNACLIHNHPDGQVPSDKENCKLPDREPDGTLNSNGVHAAASVLAGGRGGVDATADQKKQAAQSLLSAYKQIGDTPPDSLSSLAGKSATTRARKPARMSRDGFVLRFLVNQARSKSAADGHDSISPADMASAIDAALDYACDLFDQVDITECPAEVQEAVALVQAAGATVDTLLDALGIPDPDDELGDSSAAAGSDNAAPASDAGAAKSATAAAVDDLKQRTQALRLHAIGNLRTYNPERTA